MSAELAACNRGIAAEVLLFAPDRAVSVVAVIHHIHQDTIPCMFMHFIAMGVPTEARTFRTAYRFVLMGVEQIWSDIPPPLCCPDSLFEQNFPEKGLRLRA